MKRNLERLKELRLYAEITQKQTAEIINVSPSRMSRYESGKVQ